MRGKDFTNGTRQEAIGPADVTGGRDEVCRAETTSHLVCHPYQCVLLYTSGGGF